MSLYADIIGIDWSDMNCGEACREGLRRLGMREAAKAVPVDQESAAHLFALLNAGKAPWEKIGTERHLAQVGDVVVSDGPECAYHIAVVISQNTTLTSSRDRGVYCWPLNRTPGVVGVYRYRKAPQ